MPVVLASPYLRGRNCPTVSFIKINPTSERCQDFICINLVDYVLQLMKTRNSVSQKIRIRPVQKIFFIREMSAFWKVCSYICTRLGLVLHELLHQCGVAWSRSAFGLLRRYGSPGCFDSSLRLICIVRSHVSHHPLNNTPYILVKYGEDQASMLANKAQ